jgi:3-dehydroquinate synthetase
VPTLDHYAESDFNEMCPQYGHAIGHAVEALSWSAPHAPLLHGEAVAIGTFVRSHCSGLNNAPLVSHCVRSAGVVVALCNFCFVLQACV